MNVIIMEQKRYYKKSRSYAYAYEYITFIDDGTIDGGNHLITANSLVMSKEIAKAMNWTITEIVEAPQ